MIHQFFTEKFTKITLANVRIIFGRTIPESKSKNNFSSFAVESYVQSKGKLNLIFSPEKLLKRKKIALFSIVKQLKQRDSLKSTLMLNRGLLNYLAGVNK